jgi:glutamate-1-semialdehyde 2,1-aminomutase
LATDEVYAHLDATADVLKTAVSEALSVSGVAHVVQAAGTMFSVFFAAPGAGGIRDFDDAQRTDTAAYAAFFHAMLDHGVHLPPSAYEAWFLSAAHDDRAVQTVLGALPHAARAAAASQERPTP